MGQAFSGEWLASTSIPRLPTALRAFAIELPDDVSTEAAELAADDPTECREYGDVWAASLRSAALLVPSVLVPPVLHPGVIGTDERNVLLNPRHLSARSWQVAETRFRVDARFRPGRTA